MRLIPINEVADAATYLYALLAEREPHQSISHKGMPTVDEHLIFVRSEPYAEWYLLVCGVDTVVGSVYLTRANEIGIAVFKAYRRRHLGRLAVQMLIDKHKGCRLLANIAPGNEPSRRMFEALGFTLIQNTFEKGRNANVTGLAPEKGN